jgi:hypothetical protein
MKRGRWYSFEVCRKCYRRLTDSIVMNNNATCIHCGHTVDGTICETFKVTLRETRHNKWWQRKNLTYEAANDHSQKWLNLIESKIKE